MFKGFALFFEGAEVVVCGVAIVVGLVAGFGTVVEQEAGDFHAAVTDGDEDGGVADGISGAEEGLHVVDAHFLHFVDEDFAVVAGAVPFAFRAECLSDVVEYSCAVSVAFNDTSCQCLDNLGKCLSVVIVGE